jgi:DNA-binding response OmpR family regulator
LADDRHQIEHQLQDVGMRELLDADIVFAGGKPFEYMSLLRRVREARPTLAFVVVTRIPETKEWLDALEAGATDYYSEPIETRPLNWLVEAALSPFAGSSWRAVILILDLSAILHHFNHRERQSRDILILMECDECDRLRKDSDRLQKIHLSALEATKTGYNAPARQFAPLKTASDEAWRKAEIARLELEQHERGHEI